MQDNTQAPLPDLADLSQQEWLDELAGLGQEEGFYQDLGPAHHAVFADRGDTLVVSFQSIDEARGFDDRQRPFGFEIIETSGWSQLMLFSDGDTWFRAEQVLDFFDQLIDDGFFDEFENVLFLGAGPGGYAAAAFSVAAPGARALLLQPHATLDPRVTEWDPRHTDMRRTDFTSRFGYAPDMLDAAMQAWVVYDPRAPLEAMHSALYHRPNVTRFRLPHMSEAMVHDLSHMNALLPLVTQAALGTLTLQSFGQIARARRDHNGYLRRLLAEIDAQGRDRLAEMLCQNVSSRLRAPRFRRRLAELQNLQQSA